jgi:hypothetical protein
MLWCDPGWRIGACGARAPFTRQRPRAPSKQAPLHLQRRRQPPSVQAWDGDRGCVSRHRARLRSEQLPDIDRMEFTRPASAASSSSVSLLSGFFSRSGIAQTARPYPLARTRMDLSPVAIVTGRPAACWRDRAAARISASWPGSPRSAERPTGDFVFVLIGFQLSFHGDDHHINEVRIIESDGNLTVRFRDKHSAPPPISLWSLQYAYVPRSLFVELGTSSGSDRGAVGLDIPAGPSVIRGFSFDFRSDDHHLREIGVLTGSGRLEVYYADKNMDDLFDWAVDWGILAT